tara:strand:- start:6104 stop:6337 length:234 start_codon:yes stop_codon:yes gene_type:complete
VLIETYQSHSFEPAIGDAIVNINPGCSHKGSQGIVLSVNDLPSEQGKVVEYQCINNGPTWDVGDTLSKTMDQLAPLG